MMNLKGKAAVVLGVADRESLAWAIAKSLHEAGARVWIGYQQKFLSRVTPLLKDFPSIQGQRCDVLNPDEMEEFFGGFQQGIDILVHSIAFGPETVFTQLPSQVNSADFSETLEVSAHSLSKVIRFAKPFLNPWASVMTLTFQASQRAMPMYGMMGVAKAALESLVRYLAIELGRSRIRVNAISAGPVETLAALYEIVALKRNPEAMQELASPVLRDAILQLGASIGHPEDELAFARKCWALVQGSFAERSPIPEKVFAEDIADTALFLASDRSRKITGQVLHVDAGFSTCQLG